jgi:arsenate reductase (thioredoxin)
MADQRPCIPGKRYLGWDLPDPKGRSVEEVREARDDISERTRALFARLDRRAN